MHFLAPHVQGHVTAQCHLCQLTILQEKRDLVTGPMQPDDVQRIIADIAFTRCGGRLASSSSDQASPSLSHIGLFGQPIFHSSNTGDLKSIHVFFRNYVQGEKRTLLEDISGEKEVRMSELMKRLKVSLSGTTAGSF